MLDGINVKILEVLQREGRISMLDLADRVGLSATPCARRVKQMENSGVIDHYAAQVSPRVIGLELSAIINVRLRHSKRAATAFENTVKEMPRVIG